MLVESSVSLVEAHDLFMFDLDGVIYVGPHAVAGVAEHVGAIKGAGTEVAFVTNNANRSTATVARHLNDLGIPCVVEDVVNSAQAAAALLAGKHPRGARILVLGGDGLRTAVSEAGLVPVADPEDHDVVELVTGFGPDVLWRDIMRAAARVRDGLAWTASNTDMTFPTEHGKLPGHGMLVELISRFAGVVPAVAGKPERPLLDATIQRKGGLRPLMVGDRLDTDILGGRNAGVATLLVLTGVSGLAEVAAALPNERPDFICPTLASAFEPQSVPVHGAEGWILGGWRASVRDGALAVEGTGSAADWWRTVAAACWQHLDSTGVPAVVHNTVPPLTD